MRRLARLAPLAAVLTAGCFATRNDVRLLQADISRLQATLAAQRAADEREAARRDSVREEEMREIAQILSITDDSLRSLIRQFGGFRTSVLEDVDSMRQQLILIYGMQGASASRLAELQRELEAGRNRTQVAVAAADSTRRDSLPVVVEGPATLYQTGFSLLQRGSTTYARSTFDELIQKFPDSEYAPRALLRIADAFQADSNEEAADSVLALVVQRYARSPEAPTALYKRAEALAKAGQTQRALQLYDRIVADYPQSEVVPLARDRAAALRRD